MSKSELLNKISMLLGGRAAEEIVFEDISTGAHNDLSRATDIARSMVKEYGMSEKVGQVYFAREKRAPFLNVMPEGAVEYSDATAKLIDQEVRQIIQRQYENALEILRGTRHLLEQTAEQLLEVEVIEGEALQKLREKVTIVAIDRPPEPTAEDG
jgi:cell division protease FtsH